MFSRRLRGRASDRDAPEGPGRKTNRVGDGHRAGDDDQVHQDAFFDLHAGEERQHHGHQDDRAAGREEREQRVLCAEQDRQHRDHGPGEITAAHDERGAERLFFHPGRDRIPLEELLFGQRC
jgi:hypothetical protein